MTIIQETRSPVAPASPNLPLVAPVRHTIILVAIFVGLAAAGAVFQRSAPHTVAPAAQPPGSPAALYLSLIAAEWGLVYYVWKGGLRRTGTRLRDLIGGSWSTSAAGARQVARDLALAAGLWVTWSLVSSALTRMAGPDHAAGISQFLPRRPVDVALWVGLSVSAGFAEEVVFRGYLQRQFAALTRSRWIGLALQAALFGIAHGYQGVAACGRIALFGALYGALALWRGSLRPGMIAHAGTDILSGIFRI